MRQHRSTGSSSILRRVCYAPPAGDGQDAAANAPVSPDVAADGLFAALDAEAEEEARAGRRARTRRQGGSEGRAAGAHRFRTCPRPARSVYFG